MPLLCKMNWALNAKNLLKDIYMIFSDGYWRVSGKMLSCLAFTFLVVIMLSTTAQARDSLAPLSQGDIDGYVYLLPRLRGDIAKNQVEALGILRDAGLTRERAAFVATKVAISQSILDGLLSPSQLDNGKIPYRLRPSAEELNLVQKNITSLEQAQHLAKRANPILP